MELLRRTGPATIGIEYRDGRPRDIDGPALAAEALGRLLAAGAEGRMRRTRVFAAGAAAGVDRLWPMVEALAGGPVEATFTVAPDGADCVVNADTGPVAAWVQAARRDADGAVVQETRIALVDPVIAAAPHVGGSDMPAWWLREEPDLIGLRGGRCPACGRVEFPAPPAGCPRCRVTPDAHVLATTGRVLTWTVDRLYESRIATGMVVVDLDDGGRFYGQLADGCDPEGLVAGAAVRLVPRVLHADERRTAYFWKVSTEGCRG